MIVGVGNPPEATRDIDILLCWLSANPLRVGGKYAIKHTTRDVRCVVREILYKIDINTLDRIEQDAPVQMNDITRVSVTTTAPLFIDAYSGNRLTGSLILIDEAGNETVGAGITDDLAPQV